MGAAVRSCILFRDIAWDEQILWEQQLPVMSQKNNGKIVALD